MSHQEVLGLLSDNIFLRTYLPGQRYLVGECLVFDGKWMKMAYVCRFTVGKA